MTAAAADPLLPKDLHTIEIKKRPPRTLLRRVLGLIAITVFFVSCITAHITQLLFIVPIGLLPYAWAQAWYDAGVRYTKGTFGVISMALCQVFAPTSLSLTFETEGPGALTTDEIEKIVVRNAAGEVTELRMSNRMVIMANHQIYADWWYIWNLTYFMKIHRDVLIVLKRSLKWIPVLGWGMQIFRFIFLARSWASDRVYFVSQLAGTGKRAEQNNTPLAFVIFPEGTICDGDGMLHSQKYADKIGIPNTEHVLLPRSTGLLYALRALAPRVPKLKLLDLTIVYPGIPPSEYGKHYYTLRSIFMDGVPPPTVHMHIRLFDVATSVPIGDLSLSKLSNIPDEENGLTHSDPVEAEVPESERIAFDLWLRDLWREKDSKFLEYLTHGVLKSGEKSVEVPIKLSSYPAFSDIFSFFPSIVALYAWKRLKEW